MSNLLINWQFFQHNVIKPAELNKQRNLFFIVRIPNRKIDSFVFISEKCASNELFCVYMMLDRVFLLNHHPIRFLNILSIFKILFCFDLY